MTSNELQQKIDQTEKELILLRKAKTDLEELLQIQKTCLHVLDVSNLGLMSASCKICKKDLGWKCLKSPDGICHFYNEAYVVLLDGNHFRINPHKTRYFKSLGLKEIDDEEHCLLCGHPKERHQA